MSEPDKAPFIFTRRERAAKPWVACFVLWKFSLSYWSPPILGTGASHCVCQLGSFAYTSPQYATLWHTKMQTCEAKKALVIRIFPDKDRVLHCSKSLFILHDRPAGVWLCWLIKLIASRFDDSFVTRLQKQCIELESKHIPSLFYVAAKFSWLFT